MPVRFADDLWNATDLGCDERDATRVQLDDGVREVVDEARRDYERRVLRRQPLECFERAERALDVILDPWHLSHRFQDELVARASLRARVLAEERNVRHAMTCRANPRERFTEEVKAFSCLQTAEEDQMVKRTCMHDPFARTFNFGVIAVRDDRGWAW